MRTPALLLAMSLSVTAVVAGGYAPADFPSYSVLPSRAKPWFQHLAAAQEKTDEIHLLAKVPEAEPALVELMQKITSDPAGSPEHLRLVIQTIHARRGLSAAGEVWLRELLLSRLSRSNGPVDEVLKTEGLLLLEYRPCPENETVLVQYLNDTTAHSDRMDKNAVYSAICMLKRTGTLSSIRPLSECAESHRAEPWDAGGMLCVYAMEAMDSIENRAAPTSPALQSLFTECFPWCIPNPEAMARAEKALATRPELKPQLLALLKAQYFESIRGGGRGNITALKALALRSDLTPAEQKMITAELETHVAPEDQSGFISPALRLLAHYPSPEHEALALRFINRDAGQRGILWAAFSTLSIIGGEKSLAAMREAQANLKAKGLESDFLQRLDEHINNMQRWLDRTTPPAERHF